MDNQAESDAVFIGRYVLVEYDDPPITGYKYENAFYSDEQHTKVIQPVVGRIYQDLHQVNTTSSFYVYDGTGSYTAAGSSTTFTENYNRDVTAYGRGYDSTAWMKTVDTNTGKYRYVMVAELNTVVPNFHLVADPPSATPIAPYFDGQTTNLDYYIHMPTPYGQQIAVNSDGLTDEKVYHRSALFDQSTGTYFIAEDLQPTPGDIFYNKAGFRKEVRTRIDQNKYFVDSNSEYSVDSINFTLGSSGRKYYGTHGDGQIGNDTIFWHIYLPSIGNAVSDVWDYMFTSERKLQFLYENFENAPSAAIDSEVTADTGSVLGVTNTARCYIGRVYELASATDEYTDPAIESTYLNAIRYHDTTDRREYYYPMYSSTWAVGTGDNAKYYYDNTDHTYKLANKNALPAGTAYYVRTSTVSNNPVVRYKKAYSRSLSGIIAGGRSAVDADIATIDAIPNTLFGAIAYMNRLMGTGLHADDSRDERTVIGLMNRMKDIIDNVDTQIVPGRLIGSSTDGTYTTTNILYPYAGTGNHQEILDSSGTWRLPVTYKLETLDLKNQTDTSKYFDAGYYGNSCLHAVLAADTLGEAVKKMQNEMADIQYKTQTVDSFTVTLTGGESTLLENGASMTKATLKYTLNKGPRQSITITRTAPTTATIYSQENIDPEYYVTNSTAYAASASGTLEDTNTITSRTDTAMTWKISVKDERDAVAEKSVSAYWCNRYYYGIGANISDLSTIDTYAELTSAITGGGNKLARSKAGLSLTMTPGANQYMYYMQPAAWADPTFKIGGFEGGMDLLGTFSFTNQNSYATNYKIWKSTMANLGSTVLAIS